MLASLAQWLSVCSVCKLYLQVLLCDEIHDIVLNGDTKIFLATSVWELLEPNDNFMVIFGTWSGWYGDIAK
jgi:hypothetical protein